MSKSVIICVDDEDVVLRSLKSQLKLHFGNAYLIETAESGEEALELIEDLMEEGYHLPVLISDQIMPGMKGDELLQQVHAEHRKTLKILLTGQASADAVGNAVNKAGLYRYISKPWDPADLNLTVSEAIRSFMQGQELAERNKELNEKNAQLEEAQKQLRDYADTLEERVKERTAALQKASDNIKSSIVYAKRIQDAVLPSASEMHRFLPDSFVYFRPRDIVSGDFYFYAELEGRVVVAAVDCTGHGVPGAFMSLIGSNLLYQIVVGEREMRPDRILSKLHNGINQALKQQETENQDGMDMAVCSIDMGGRIVEYAGAKNPLVFIHDGVAEEVKADKKPIGGMYGSSLEEREYALHRFTPDQDATFYIFSDGFQDQFGGPEGRKFMRKRFRETLLEASKLPLEAQTDFLNQKLEDWLQNGRYTQIDDILVMGFRV